MTQPPDLIPFDGTWPDYEDLIYEAFVESFVRPEISFQGLPVSAPYRPETRGKHYSFWHVISEAPHPGNRNEEDRIPNLDRCARIKWIAWLIQLVAEGHEDVSWWENKRGRDTNVVIWAEPWDFAVILGKRRDYYMLITAYCNLRDGRKKAFRREREAFWKA